MRIKHLTVVAAVLLVALPSAVPSWAQSEVDPTYPDIFYVSEEHADQTLDIYLPMEGEGPFPVVVTIYDSPQPVDATMRSLKRHFREQGYAVVVISHRPGYPEPLEDNFCALAWLYANADTYDLDATRIVVFGYGMGGLVAGFLGTVDDPGQFMAACPHSLPEDAAVQGVITFASPFDMISDSEFLSFATSVTDLSPGEIADALETMDGIPPAEWSESSVLSEEARHLGQVMRVAYWVDGNDPPVLIIHGDDDDVVESEAPIDFATLLEAAGVDVELILMRGHGHGFALFQDLMPEADEAVDAFLAACFEEG